jgi:hypothetical protein
MALVGPTSRTRYSSARGGGLDTLFPLFFTLFWVANSLNSRPKTCPNLIKPNVSSTLTNLAAVGCTLKWLCRT